MTRMSYAAGQPRPPANPSPRERPTCATRLTRPWRLFRVDSCEAARLPVPHMSTQSRVESSNVVFCCAAYRFIYLFIVWKSSMAALTIPALRSGAARHRHVVLGARWASWRPHLRSQHDAQRLREAAVCKYAHTSAHLRTSPADAQERPPDGSGTRTCCRISPHVDCHGGARGRDAVGGPARALWGCALGDACARPGRAWRLGCTQHARQNVGRALLLGRGHPRRSWWHLHLHGSRRCLRRPFKSISCNPWAWGNLFCSKFLPLNYFRPRPGIFSMCHIWPTCCRGKFWSPSQGIQKRGDGHFIFSACPESKIIDRKSIGNQNRPRDWQKKGEKGREMQQQSLIPSAGLEPPPSKGVHLSRKRSTTTPRGHIRTTECKQLVSCTVCRGSARTGVSDTPPKKSWVAPPSWQHDVRTWYERRCHALLGRTRTGHQTWRAEVAFGTRRVHGM